MITKLDFYYTAFVYSTHYASGRSGSISMQNADEITEMHGRRSRTRIDTLPADSTFVVEGEYLPESIRRKNRESYRLPMRKWNEVRALLLARVKPLPEPASV